jgi:hypothetical protein
LNSELNLIRNSASFSVLISPANLFLNFGPSYAPKLNPIASKTDSNWWV